MLHPLLKKKSMPFKKKEDFTVMNVYSLLGYLDERGVVHIYILGSKMT
jgi:hypothetical protein